MRVIGFLRHRRVELAWVAFAVANLVAMALWPSWETIPFHFIWISLTLALRLPGLVPRRPAFVLALVVPRRAP